MVLAGCGGGSVDVLPPSPTGAAEAACNRLSEALPEQISGLPARASEPESPYIRAWGDPAVVLRCGVSKPATLEPESQVIGVNRVEWLAEEQSSGYRFTTTGREAYVEVFVPDDYAPEVDPLVALAAPVKRAVPEAHDHGTHEH